MERYISLSLSLSLSRERAKWSRVSSLGACSSYGGKLLMWMVNVGTHREKRERRIFWFFTCSSVDHTDFSISKDSFKFKFWRETTDRAHNIIALLILHAPARTELTTEDRTLIIITSNDNYSRQSRTNERTNGRRRHRKRRQWHDNDN